MARKKKSESKTDENKALRDELESLKKEYANLEMAMRMVLEQSLAIENRLLERQEELIDQVRAAPDGDFEEKRRLLMGMMEEVFSQYERMSQKLESEPVVISVSHVLTPRQREILHALAAGKSNKRIAKDFDVSEGTVKQHVSNIYKALKANNRAEAVARATEMGLL